MPNEHYKEYSILAGRIEESIYGMKGPTVWTKIIKLPDQIPFDFMHLILQGHFKFKLNQYFFQIKKSDCYIGKHTNDINLFISKLKLPHDINRKLVSLEESKMWKSSQYKTFFFYVIVQLLMNFLPPYYFHLLSSYIFAIRLLYEPIEFESDISYAETSKDAWSFTLSFAICF